VTVTPHRGDDPAELRAEIERLRRQLDAGDGGEAVLRPIVSADGAIVEVRWMGHVWNIPPKLLRENAIRCLRVAEIADRDFETMKYLLTELQMPAEDAFRMVVGMSQHRGDETVLEQPS